MSQFGSKVDTFAKMETAVKICFAIFALLQCVCAQDGPDDPRCVPITNSLCQGVGWTVGTVPNFLNQHDLRTIDDEVSQYLPLYDTGCSNAFLHFLCSIYYPPCFQNNVTGSLQTVVWQPCQELCDYVYCSCLDSVLRLGGEWPDRLVCPRFPSHRKGEACFPGNVELSFLEDLVLPTIPERELPISRKCTDIPGPSPNTSTPTTPTTTLPSSTLHCPIPTLAAPNGSGDRYSLGSQVGCSVPCDSSVYYDSDDADTTIPVVILIFSVLSLVLSVLMISAFLIDRSRFYYPERPVVYLGVNFILLSAALLLSSIATLANYPFACEDESLVIYQRLPAANISFRGVLCILIAILLYYTTMATLVWWVVLTITWLLATTLKWAAEAIAKFWIVYHIVGWGLPLVQTIIVVGVQWIDGEAGSGVCYLGNLDMVAKGVFVFVPTLAYILLGLVIFTISCLSLFNIRAQIKRQHDSEKVTRLHKLLLHVLLFSLLFTLPNLILCVIYIFELANEDQWEINLLCQLSQSHCPVQSNSNTAAPVAMVAFKYILWVFPCSSLLVWVLSRKTLQSCGHLMWSISEQDQQGYRGSVHNYNGSLPRDIK
uniref:FzdD n=1 Tax=Halisarca dujardinii TaxID=2583056 RepID=A0AAU8KZ66_HALDU